MILLLFKGLSEYSNDVDFMNEDKDILTALLPTATNIFREWSLEINVQKTEFVHVFIADPNEKLDDGLKLHGHEPWRKTKLLGSLLCSSADILHRINLSNIAFKSFNNVWLNGSKISLERKLRIYEAQVVSVLLYNSGCWSAPKVVMEKLDTCHRKHLRSILNVRWPVSVMSNSTLYKRCKTNKLSDRVKRSRLRLLGHILRSPESSPGQSALCFVINSITSSKLKGRLGRHSTNLLSPLKKDIESFNLYIDHMDNYVIHSTQLQYFFPNKNFQMLTLSDYSDILILRQLACDHERWASIFKLSEK